MSFSMAGIGGREPTIRRFENPDDVEADLFDLQFHVAVVGDTGVGKTTIIETECLRGGDVMEDEDSEGNSADEEEAVGHEFEYAEGGFEGIKFRSRTYRHLVSLDFALMGPPKLRLLDARVKVTYWDVPGKEELLDLSCQLCSGVAAVVYVFDVNNPGTFEDIKIWMGILEQDSPMTKIIVGNKADLPRTQSHVSMKKGNQFAERLNTFYYEISAKAGAGVSHTFNLIRSDVLQKINGESVNRLRRRVHETRVQLGHSVLGKDRLAENPVATPHLSQTTDECDWL